MSCVGGSRHNPEGPNRGSVDALKGGLMSEHQIFAKCAWRLIPFMMVLYLVNYIDRVNVGFAALTMNKDLGFSPTVFGILAAWGALSAGCALVQGPLSFYILRFFLGIAEAGLVPGMLLYLTYWF